MWSREYYGSGIGIPAIARDGTLYTTDGRGLYAITPDSIQKERTWVPGHALKSLLIGDQGMVFVTSDSVLNTASPIQMANYLHAFTPDGSEAWRLSLLPSGRSWTGGVASILALASNGNILVSTSVDSMLYAVSPSGTLRWQYQATTRITDLAVGPDGLIRVVTTGGVLALDYAGRLQWQWVSEHPIGAQVAIDGSGNTIVCTDFYMGSPGTIGTIYIISPEGLLLSEVALAKSWGLLSSPVIDVAGNILYLEPPVPGGTDKTSILHCLTSEGDTYWEFSFLGDGWSDLAIGTDGMIYLLGQERGRADLHAIDAQGFEQWQIILTDHYPQGFTMGEDGILYLINGDYLYAIRTDSPGLADSPWPKAHHDPQNTGRYAGVPTAVLAERGSLPVAFNLGPSYPNPFNGSTVIPFTLTTATRLDLCVYDVLGRKVAVLAQGWFTAGRHQVLWEPGAQASGVYLCRLAAPNAMLTRRLLLAK